METAKEREVMRSQAGPETKEGTQNIVMTCDSLDTCMYYACPPCHVFS